MEIIKICNTCKYKKHFTNLPRLTDIVPCVDCKDHSNWNISKKYSKLVETGNLIESGYAGIVSNGNIVDRRINKTAVAIPKNTMFNVPDPKRIK